MLITVAVLSTRRWDAATPVGRVDGTVTRPVLSQASMRSLPVRPAPPCEAPPGGRQINSQDTQISGAVVCKSQAAGRHLTLSQSYQSSEKTPPKKAKASTWPARKASSFSVG